MHKENKSEQLTAQKRASADFDNSNVEQTAKISPPPLQLQVSGSKEDVEEDQKEEKSTQLLHDGAADPPPEENKNLNKTGLPAQLKSGIESLSGLSMDDVKVHRNSSKPTQLQAHAYAQGTDIHLGPGQERHLPHEAWHVVQQKQGRVKPTMQLKGAFQINDEEGLEREADVMGEKAKNAKRSDEPLRTSQVKSETPVQRRLYYASNSDREFETQDELRNFFEGAENSKVRWEDLTKAWNHESFWHVNYRGSINGRHGYVILGIEEYTARPAIAGRGNAGIKDSANAAGFEIVGRPAWTAETLEKLAPIKFRDNIRHIIPYHMIRDGLMQWLNEVSQNADNLDSIILRTRNLAVELGVDIELEAENDFDYLKALTVSILAVLNNVPGNLWAGDKTENQRLNSLRQRIAGIRGKIESEDDTAPGILAHKMLRESVEGDGDRIYKEILAGALEHFPESERELNEMEGKHVDEILQRLEISGEIDAMPSQAELARLDDEGIASFFNNFPLHFEIVQLFQNKESEQAMKLLIKLQDPYLNYKKD